MTHTEPATWNPRSFLAAVMRADSSYVAVRDALASAGFIYVVETVRSWAREGSPGPKHPAAVEALRAILPTLTR